MEGSSNGLISVLLHATVHSIIESMTEDFDCREATLESSGGFLLLCGWNRA